jgi:hypothetical protein
VNWVGAGLWGLAGGFVVEGLDFYTAVRRHGKWPWNVAGAGPTAGPRGYAIAELVRMIIGAVLAAGVAASGQVSGAMGAIAVGVATPMIVERLTKLVPLGLPAAPDTAKPQPATPAGAVEAATPSDKPGSGNSAPYPPVPPTLTEHRHPARER